MEKRESRTNSEAGAEVAEERERERRSPREEEGCEMGETNGGEIVFTGKIGILGEIFG